MSEPVAYRAMTRNWGTAQDEEWVYGPWVEGLGPRFEPLYAEESIPVVGRYIVKGGRVVEWEIDNAADERADGTYALLSPITASGNAATARSDDKNEVVQRAADEDRAALREALAPLVAHYAPWMDEYADDVECPVYSRYTFGQLRAARRALATPEKPEPFRPRQPANRDGSPFRPKDPPSAEPRQEQTGNRHKT
jgi:hypothetical protein